MLIVEDDDMLRGLLSRAFRADGYVVEEAPTLAEGIGKSGVGQFQLLLVDWNLPDGDGTDLVAAYRASGGSGATILITARNSIEDQIAGLDAGADDFVIKPFQIPPLRARVRALMRRPPQWAAQRFTIGDLTIDCDRKIAFVDGHALDLTRKEWQVLWFLARHDGRPATRADTVSEIWAESQEPDIHALQVHVSNLRRKLTARRSNVGIAARRGAGYYLVPPPETTRTGPGPSRPE